MGDRAVGAVVGRCLPVYDEGMVDLEGRAVVLLLLLVVVVGVSIVRRLVQRHTTPYAPSPKEPSTWYSYRLVVSWSKSRTRTIKSPFTLSCPLLAEGSPGCVRMR